LSAPLPVQSTLCDLSQIFGYGNTAVEKRAIFFRQVLWLLEFGREREGIDLSKVVLTHHTLKNRASSPCPSARARRLRWSRSPRPAAGSCSRWRRPCCTRFIQRVNDLFEGDLTDHDKLVYVNDVIKGKLLESQKLVVQATNNTREQFANSPDLKTEILNAVMSALEAHTAMSTQALSSETVREGRRDVLLSPARLYETLREKPRSAGEAP
jgi:type I restriction enzyme R subunit